jgi:pyruvate/2-oxoglutarate dehydrogenase complex dihydrolipoamide dehydrogenase (E3) component
MTSTTLTPEICIIGGGAAGLSVAAAAAALGVPAVLVEQSKMGGQSLNTGCVPSKALLAAARHFADLKKLPAFGIGASDAGFDWAKVRAHIQGVVAAIAPNDSAQRFRGLGVQVIKGTAHFTDRDTVVAGDTTIKAARFVIATGSLAAIPLIHGLDTVPVLTNETIFDLAECPQHLLVIGGGAVGVELAQAFRRFGAQVTIIEAMKVLGNSDPEGVDVLLAALERDGISIHADAAIRNVSREGPKIRITFETTDGEKNVEGTHVLVTAGRRPNLDSLNLAAAEVKFDAANIGVDKRLRTSNKKVFAIGDVTGGPHFTHAASYHASIFVRNTLLRIPAKVDLTIVPRVTFTDPALAQVGLSEDEASKKGRAIRVLRWSFHDNDRAQAERNTHGHIKVITDKRGRILGATIIGENASELITTWTLAVAQSLNVRAIAELVVPYPTLAEVGKRAAVAYFTPGLKIPLVQRILAFLRLRG